MRIAFRLRPGLRTTAAALLAASTALAPGGCKRSERAPNHARQSTPRTAAAPAGFVYVTINGEGKVSEFGREADGSLIFLRTARAGAANGPTGIAIDPSNRFLYLANEGDGRIYQFRINADTGDLLMIGEGSVEDGSASRPQQIAISPHGDFAYVTNAGKRGDGSVAEYAIDGATGALKPLGKFSGGGLRQPLGIAFMPNGKFVYVSDAEAGMIDVFAVEPSGKLGLLASTPSLGRKPGHPGLLAVHPSGSFVYTVDRSLGVVVVATLAQDGRLNVTATYHVGISTAGPLGIEVIAVGPNVFIYTANRGSDTVSSIAVKPGGLDLMGECPTGMGDPTGMVADPGGRNLYVVNRNASTVAQFAIGNAKGVALIPASMDFAEAPFNQQSHPLYIATTRWDRPSAAALARQQRMQ
jgi:DNA-binding beta-propeller fold protein YncE